MSDVKPKILVVDDNEQNRYVLNRTLSRIGMTVIECPTGGEGLAALAEDPDLVILDAKLPDISGFEVLRKIKNDPVTASLPVVQISAAFVTNESKIMALEAGADSYITHPIDPTVVTATIRSLLRLRKAETAARNTAAEWQATFDSLSEGVVLIDEDGSITRSNRTFKDWLGDEAHGDAISIFSKLMGTTSFLDTPRDERYTTEVNTGTRWFRVALNPVVEPASHRVVVVSDITERKISQEALRVTDRLAATGRLAHTIAHEINNPLEALTNLVFLSQQETDLNNLKIFLDMAEMELSRVAGITKKILAFHRESAQQVETDVGSLANDALALFSSEIKKKNLQVIRRLEATPSVRIFPGEIRQVLVNLIANSIEATPDGGKLMVRTRSASRRGKPGVQITVCDSGRGVPAAIRKQIFEPFYTTKELKGSGLGLWISSGLVSKQGGKISMRSSTNEGHSGTCFCIYLPLAPASESAEAFNTRAMA